MNGVETTHIIRLQPQGHSNFYDLTQFINIRLSTIKNAVISIYPQRPNNRNENNCPNLFCLFPGLPSQPPKHQIFDRSWYYLLNSPPAHDFRPNIPHKITRQKKVISCFHLSFA